MRNKFSKIIIFFILAVLVGGGFYWTYGSNKNHKSYKSNKSYKTNNKSNRTNKSYKLPKEVPLKHPIPLLWTDDNKGENLIIQSDRHYYDGSTNSTVYFAITNESGKDQKMKVSFEFKGKGKLSSVSPISSSHKKPLSRQGRMTRQSSILRSLVGAGSPSPLGSPRPLRFGSGNPTPTVIPAEAGIHSYSFSDTLLKNKTNFYQAKIEYPKGAKGEFIIIAKGDQGGYGKLDPYFSSGLVGYWSFNGQDINKATATAYDRSGQGNDGTIYGATPAIGKSGQALSFDGVDDYVDCGNDSSLDMGLKDWAVEAWIKPQGFPAEDSYYLIMNKGGYSWSTVEWSFAIRAAYNGLDFRISNGTQPIYDLSPSTDKTDTLLDGNWHHVAVSIDRDNYGRLYLDGLEVGSKSVANYQNDNISNTAPFEISHDSNYHFHGLIDEVRIYNRALSADEIAEHYRVGAARLKPNTPLTNRFTNGLVGYWSFNGQDIKGTTAYDRSGNGNNGTIYGATPAIGKSGQALSFDGKDDYVNCGNDSSLNITDAITIEAWVKINSVKTHTLLMKNGTYGLRLYPENLRVAFWNSDGIHNIHSDGYGGGSEQEANKWYHVAVTWDNSSQEVKFYVNGALISTKTFVGPLLTVNGSLLIGKVSWSNSYSTNGLIDEVRIYNRALSASEIAEHYRVGAARLKINPNSSKKTIIK